MKPESEEKSASAGKLFQMLTTSSVKNEDRAVHGMLFVQFIGVTPDSGSGSRH